MSKSDKLVVFVWSGSTMAHDIAMNRILNDHDNSLKWKSWFKIAANPLNIQEDKNWRNVPITDLGEYCVAFNPDVPPIEVFDLSVFKPVTKVNEAIVNHPRDVKRFCKDKAILLGNIIEQSDKIKDFIEEIYKSKDDTYTDAEYLLSYAIRALDPERPQLPSSWAIDLTRIYNLESIKHSLESVSTYGFRDFGEYIISGFAFMKSVDEETRKVLNLMPHLDKGFTEYGYAHGSKEALEDPSYAIAKKIQNAYISMSKLLSMLEQTLSNIKRTCDSLLRVYNFYGDSHKYRPEHEEIETLYHASIYASQIAENGFEAERPMNRNGVGNFGQQSLISFSHDIRICHDIMRSFKEIWMIVHGKLHRNQILRWMTPDEIKSAATTYMTSKEPLDSVYNTVYLYRVYISLTKTRANPMFVNLEDLIASMKEVDISDIGIVACDVKLNQDETYHYGEAEFRVKASQIVGPIKRIY